MNSPDVSISPTAQAIEIAIRLALIFLILAWCLHILSPFISIIAWGGIIAVAIYPPYQKLVAKLGGRKKLAITLFVVIGIGIIMGPIISLSTSTVHGATTLGTGIMQGQLTIPAPPGYVQTWPLIGEKTYQMWLQASQNLGEMLQQYPHQLAAVGKYLLGAAAGVGAGILQFLISTLIAVVFLSGADATDRGLRKIASRLTPQHGEALMGMMISTVRSVAVGVIGIAVIQAILGGLGMMFAGVPGAGLLAVILLVLAIAQLPPILVLGPVAFYVFSSASTTVAVIFLIWAILVSSSDMILKPLLLGRGIDVPLPVILLGAIGGMLSSGIVGLFIGAVILALGYKLLGAWLDMETAVTDTSVTAEKD